MSNERFEYLANLHESGAYMTSNERVEFVTEVNGGNA